MALKFQEQEAVEFGTLKVVPHMNAELKLRAKNLDLKTEQDLEEAIDILSQAFGDKTKEVADFMRKNMSSYDLRRLQVYLSEGPQALARVDEAVADMMTRGLENA